MREIKKMISQYNFRKADIMRIRYIVIHYTGSLGTAEELTRYLMEKYNVPEENVLRHYDVTGKVCPAPYVHNTTRHTWEEFKEALSRKEPKVDRIGLIIRALSASGKFLADFFGSMREKEPQPAPIYEPESNDGYMTLIMGRPRVSADKIAAYAIRKNPDAADLAEELAQLYIEEGIYEGVRGGLWR